MSRHETLEESEAPEVLKAQQDLNRWSLRKICAIEENNVFVTDNGERVRFEIPPSTKDLYQRKIRISPQPVVQDIHFGMTDDDESKHLF